jgi:hypothetical protein
MAILLDKEAGSRFKLNEQRENSVNTLIIFEK